MLGVTNILIFLLLVVGIIWLQIYLSKKESRWPGLIIPAIQFLFSVFITVAEVLYIPVPLESYAAYIAVQAVLVFLMSNIPTLISLAIYFTCRNRLRRNKQIEKMNIQDLD
nr:MAG TPA: hypothetical protein [Caudoviricetes sp.]